MAGTIVKNIARGGTQYIELLFTAAAAADEIEITGLPDQVTITRLTAVLTAGTGTTVNPAIGRSTGFAAGDFDELGSDIDGSPAARVSTVADNEIETNGSLFVQPRVDAAADNTIRMELHVKHGWESSP